MSDNLRQNLFNEWADGYDQTVEPTNDFPFAGYSEVLATIVTQAQPSPSLRVLDVGTGTGNLAAHFTAAGCNVVGVDFSEAMLVRAQAKVPLAHFIHLDILGTWPSNLQSPFDRIVSAYVWHEFDLATKLMLLKRFTSYLSHDGWIIIGDIAFATLEEQIHARQATSAWDEDEYYWVVDEAQTAAETIGLTLVYHRVSWCSGIFTCRIA